MIELQCRGGVMLVIDFCLQSFLMKKVDGMMDRCGSSRLRLVNSLYYTFLFYLKVNRTEVPLKTSPAENHIQDVDLVGHKIHIL